MNKNTAARKVYTTEAERIKGLQEMLKAAIRIQNWWRIILARKVFRAKQMARDKLMELQAIANELIRKHHAAIVIQCAIRRFLANKIADALYKAQKLKKRKERKSALKIQKVYRGYQGRKIAAEERKKKIIMNKKHAAATQIQRIVRGRIGRKKARDKRIYKEKMQKRREKCALRIQSRWKSYHAWKAVDSMRVAKGIWIRSSIPHHIWEERAPSARSSVNSKLQNIVDVSMNSLSDQHILRVLKSPLQTEKLSKVICQEMTENLVVGPLCLKSDLLEITIALRANRRTSGWFFRKKGNIGDDGLIAISKALRSNFAMQKLVFGSNNLKIEGITHLVETFRRYNYGIEQLILEDNEVGDKGAVCFGLLLKDYFFSKYCKLTEVRICSFQKNLELHIT